LKATTLTNWMAPVRHEADVLMRDRFDVPEGFSVDASPVSHLALLFFLARWDLYDLGLYEEADE